MNLRFHAPLQVLPRLLVPLCFLFPATAVVGAAAGNRGALVKTAGHELAAALVKGDSTILERLLADDFRYIHSTGKLETKRLFLDGIAAGKIQYEWMKLSDLVSDEVTADVVVLSGKIDQRKFSSGRWGEIVLLFHSVWRKEAGDWRLVSLQTVFPPPPAPKP